MPPANLKNDKILVCKTYPEHPVLCGSLSNAYKFHPDLLYVKQEHLICLIFQVGYLDHAANLFCSFNILPFFHLIRHQIEIFMYKVYHEMFPLTILKLFTHCYSYCLSPQSFTFYFNYIYRIKKQKCFVNAGICIWNLLALNI